MIGFNETLNPHQNSQAWGQINPQQTFGQQAGGFANQGPWSGMGHGPGQAAFGQPYGQFGGQQYGQSNLGAGNFGAWGNQQRQLSPQDANEVVRQLIPLLPQVIAQAQQQQPMAAFGYGQRMLTQQDVNEVVRQILPIVPQIVAQLQGQPHLNATQTGIGYGQQGYGQQAWPQMHAAFGGYQQGHTNRYLTQQDVSEVVRQLVGVIPQVINNLQAGGQQRVS